MSLKKNESIASKIRCKLSSDNVLSLFSHLPHWKDESLATEPNMPIATRTPQRTTMVSLPNLLDRAICLLLLLLHYFQYWIRHNSRHCLPQHLWQREYFVEWWWMDSWWWCWYWCCYDRSQMPLPRLSMMQLQLLFLWLLMLPMKLTPTKLKLTLFHHCHCCREYHRCVTVDHLQQRIQHITVPLHAKSRKYKTCDDYCVRWK